MLIHEVTNAEDQLKLLKRIIDSTWSAIAAEAAAEAAAKQQRAAAAAAKPRKSPKVQPKRRTAPKAIVSKPNTQTQAQRTAVQPNQSHSAQPNQAVTTDAAQAIQPRRVYPAPKSTTTEIPIQTMPIARLGKVAAVSNP